MRRILSLFLILIVALSTFKHATTFLFFKLNQDYIAQNICVEKDIEESTCNGCCHLKKQQTEQKESENRTIPNQKETFNIDLFYTKLVSINLVQNHITKSWICSNALYHFSFPQSIFRPPQVI